MSNADNKSGYLIPPEKKPTITGIDATPDFLEVFYNLFRECAPKGERDISYASALIADFGSDLDLFEELKNFHAWTIDRPDGPVRYPRSQFRRWLKRSRFYHFNFGSKISRQGGSQDEH
jgi:hypothetical protein